ncbi:class I SAM-dependent methyltransferase [Candidatus Pacearchaeota archaeon]|nr:class I SAM-dependent methyltransferase [Candidatus Pacearchaeota archaeon]
MNYKEETRNSYNKNARKFSEKFLELMDLKKRGEFQRFISLIPGKKILDLGCGSGDHAYFFQQKGLDVIAVDISEEMINLCKKKGINAFIMDIEDLKFEDNTFDGIWAVTSLLHIPKSKLPAVIDKLHKILKKNGILHVCVKEGIGEKIIKDEDKNTRRFFAFWQEEEILKLFRGNFAIISSEKAGLGKTIFLQFFFKKPN